MTTTYIVAQVFGIFATISCFLVPMFKKKWQIFTGAIFNNLFIGLNFIMLGEIVSGLMSLVGILQCVLIIIHTLRDKPVPMAETIAFTALGIVMSISGLVDVNGGFRLLGVLPLIAVFAYNISAFVRKEQTIRWFLLVNAGAWVVYDAIIMATSFFGHAVGFASTAIALFTYRGQNKETAKIGQ